MNRSTLPLTIHTPDSGRIAQICLLLEAIFKAGEIFEVRIPKHGESPHTLAGVFDDPQKAAAAIVSADQRLPRGIYFTINPLKREWLDQMAVNTLQRAGRGTLATDDAVVLRSCLFIDIDPERPANASATDIERQAAGDLSARIRFWLVENCGWPEPIELDSGNGRYLLFSVDLPNDQSTGSLVKEILSAIGQHCDTAEAKVDLKVCNASRIARAPATLNRKGTSTKDRPHRFCQVLSIPNGWRDIPVPMAKLQAVADLAAHAGLTTHTQSLPLAAPADDVIERCRKYIAKCPPAVEGQGGHDQTFLVAQHIFRGFSLSETDGWLLLLEYNAHCQPSWSEAELRHKMREAIENGTAIDIGQHLQVGTAASPERVQVIIGTDEFRVNKEVLAAIPRLSNLYQRAGQLVHVGGSHPLFDGIQRATYAPRITPYPTSLLRSQITSIIDFRRPTLRKDEEVLVPASPPQWNVQFIRDNGDWPGVRYLTGIPSGPTLRPDGSILCQSGYDPATGLVLVDSVPLPNIRVSPSRARAGAALQRLLGLVSDFPFQDEAHLAAWLAALLTGTARHAFRGPAPLFLIDANIRGSGKSLLADVIAEIVTGRSAPRFSNPCGDEEVRKRITALALSGDEIVLIDNIVGSFGSASLDAALTSETWSDRILGRSETVALPLQITWMATGNNVALQADTSRRVLYIRLESSEEQPELREDFRRPDLRLFVRENRPQLLADALTILSAYCAAGRPKQGLRPWGSFEAWSSLIREAVVWLGLPDPGETRQQLAAQSDVQSLALRELYVGWSEIDPQCEGLTGNELRKRLESDPVRFDQVRGAVMELCASTGGKTPSVQVIGSRFRELRGRPCGGKVLESQQNRNGTQVWRVRELNFRDRAAGDADCAGCSPAAVQASQEVTERRQAALNWGEKVSPHSIREVKQPASPAQPAERDFIDPLQDPEAHRDNPRPVQHRQESGGCACRTYWVHAFGDRYCSECWPCTDRSMMVREGTVER